MVHQAILLIHRLRVQLLQARMAGMEGMALLTMVGLPTHLILRLVMEALPLNEALHLRRMVRIRTHLLLQRMEATVAMPPLRMATHRLRKRMEGMDPLAMATLLQRHQIMAGMARTIKERTGRTHITSRLLLDLNTNSNSSHLRMVGMEDMDRMATETSSMVDMDLQEEGAGKETRSRRPVH